MAVCVRVCACSVCVCAFAHFVYKSGGCARVRTYVCVRVCVHCVKCVCVHACCVRVRQCKRVF